MTEPWDRQEGEPNNWFARFEAFRLAGPQRKLQSIYNAEREKIGKGKSTSTPPSWTEAAAKWRWKERAEAWDAEQIRITREEEKAELAHRRKVWIAQSQALQSKGAERLLQMEADELTPRDVLAFFAEGLKLELLARGEATSVTETRGGVIRIIEACGPPGGKEEDGSGSGDDPERDDEAVVPPGAVEGVAE